MHPSERPCPKNAGIHWKLRANGDCGLALVICLIVLALFTLIGLSLAVNASTEMRIGDNFEALVQSRQAALAGLHHAAELLRGPDFDDLLAGPDGTYDHGSGYLAYARRHRYRNPLDWPAAAEVDIDDPGAWVSDLPDDGLIHSGYCNGAAGTVLIPLRGAACSLLPVPGGDARAVSRYFVKASDNNGEASELGADPSDNPFLDGDGVVVVRSLGIARTIGEVVGPRERRNSITVYEARYRRRQAFDLDAAVTLCARDVWPSGPAMFEGQEFHIHGGSAEPGIGVLDPGRGDGIEPWRQVTSYVGAEQEEQIQGAGLVPSVIDLTSSVHAHPDKRLLLDGLYLADFISRTVPRAADSVFAGDLDWPGTGTPDLGAYDPALPCNAAAQRPRVTFVKGSLAVSGEISGAGILIVQGGLHVTGRLAFSGLILVVGTGDLALKGAGTEIHGAVFVAGVPALGGTASHEEARFSIGGGAQVIFDRNAVRMAVRLLPVSQEGFREITSTTDP